MKINKVKLLVGTMAIAAVAATVGSISGTVAWFQYSTRSTLEYQGASAHCSESLQVRLYHAAKDAVGNPEDPGYQPAVAEFDSGWKQDLSIANVQSYIASGHARGSADYNLYPVTTGNLASAASFPTTFYKSPIYQYSADYVPAEGASYWQDATVKDYIDLPLQFRVVDINGSRTDGDYNTFLAKKVYLSDLTIKSSSTGSKLDITPAIRVAFDATNDGVFSLDGQAVATTGKLDLNGDGNTDQTVGYSWDSRTDFVYGTAASSAASNKIQVAESTGSNLEIADDSDPRNIIGKELGSTAANASLNVTVRIYLEGWQGLAKNGTLANKAAITAVDTPATGDSYRAADDGKIWKYNGTEWEQDAVGEKVWNDEKFVGATFNIGMRFTAEAHTDGHN